MSVVIFAAPPSPVEIEEPLEAEDDLGLLPVEDEPFGEDEELDALDNPEDDDLVVSQDPDVPLGRSWAFDFTMGRFRFSPARGPIEVRGEFTLREWIEKCVRTDRGRYSIHSDAYGMETPLLGVGESLGEEAFEGLEGRLYDALTFHPRIADVEDVEVTVIEDRDDLAAYEDLAEIIEESGMPAEGFAVVIFTVVLDDDSALPFQVVTT